MTYCLATREYLASLNLNYDHSWKAVPKYLVVRRAQAVKRRVYPHHDQELVDWLVEYMDGTADKVSLAPGLVPQRGEYLSRIPALVGGDFCNWK